MPAEYVPEPPVGIRQRFPQLYGQLRVVASRMLGKQPPATVTPSDLTHEAFVKLCAEEARRRAGDRSELAAKPDAAFKACFGAACRDLLADHARRRAAAKHGGNHEHHALSTSVPFDAGSPRDVLELDDAITALAALDPAGAQLAELRVFGGLTIAECAEALAMQVRTVERKWAFARAWLHSRLR